MPNTDPIRIQHTQGRGKKGVKRIACFPELGPFELSDCIAPVDNSNWKAAKTDWLVFLSKYFTRIDEQTHFKILSTIEILHQP